jgi:hypothetical protein
MANTAARANDERGPRLSSRCSLGELNAGQVKRGEKCLEQQAEDSQPGDRSAMFLPDAQHGAELWISRAQLTSARMIAPGAAPIWIAGTAEISSLHNFLRHRDLYGSSTAFNQVVSTAAPAREMRIGEPNFLDVTLPLLPWPPANC